MWAAVLVLASALLLFAPASRAQAPTAAELPLDSPIEIERAFRTGLRLIELRRPRDAVRIFRRILAKNPNLPRVRLELARAFFLAESWSESRDEFTAVLSTDVPDGVKRTILAFLNAIDARRGFDWNFSAGLSSATSSSRKYKTNVVHLDFFGSVLPFTVEREEPEAWGVTLSASGELRYHLARGNGGASTVGFVQGSVNGFEARGKRSDDHTLGLSTGVRFVFPRSVTTVAARGAIREYGHQRIENRYGLNTGYEWRSRGGGSYFASLQADRVDNQLTDFRDGTELQARGGVMQAFSGTVALGMAVQFGTLNAEAGYESYTRRGIEFLGRADLGSGFGVDAKLSYARTVYHDKAPLFLNQRADNLVALNLEIARNDVFLAGAFKPFLTVAPSRNVSNIDIYTYNEFRVLFGLKNAF